MRLGFIQSIWKGFLVSDFSEHIIYIYIYSRISLKRTLVIRTRRTTEQGVPRTHPSLARKEKCMQQNTGGHAFSSVFPSMSLQTPWCQKKKRKRVVLSISYTGLHHPSDQDTQTKWEEHVGALVSKMDRGELCMQSRKFTITYWNSPKRVNVPEGTWFSLQHLLCRGIVIDPCTYCL